MPETVQMNVNVRPETRERLAEIANQTFRGLGQTVDWIVAEAWNRLNQAASVSVETVKTAEEG